MSIATSSVADSLDGLHNKFSDDYKDKLNEIVFAKLTQIQHDMISFGLPLPQIKSMISKYIKLSRIFPQDSAEAVLERLRMAEEEQKIRKKQQMLIDDVLFDE